MMRRIAGVVVALLVLVVGLGTPGAVAAAPGISVAPQAGPVGTQFEATGAGLNPNSALSVLIEQGQVFGRTLEATADAAGHFKLAIDSTGFPESAGLSVTLFPKGGGTALATTRFETVALQAEQCFMAETGHCARGRFLQYWQAHGGLAINGYPLSDEFSEVLENGQPYVVQYFERTRLEYHPEISDPQYQVLLGQFGRRIHPADPPAPQNPSMIWFIETGHNVPHDYYLYWTTNGGLAQFGLPISEPMMEKLEDGKTYTVQYFERARFETHPENQPPYAILLGQFGRLILGQSKH